MRSFGRGSFRGCLAFSSGGLQIFLTRFSGFGDRVEELSDFVRMLTSEARLGEVGEVLHSELTVDQESLLTVLLDVVELCQFIIYLVNILFDKLDLNIGGIVVVEIAGQVNGVVLRERFLLVMLGGFDLSCLGEGTSVNILLGLLTIVDDRAQDVGHFAAVAGHLRRLLGSLVGASREFLVAQQAVDSVELDRFRLAGLLGFGGVRLELLLSFISLVDDGIDRLNGFLGVLRALLGEEGEIDLVVFVEELVRTVLRDVDLLGELIVEFGLVILARFELDEDTAAIELSQVLSVLQQRVNVDATDSAVELNRVDLIDSVFPFDIAFTFGFQLINSLLRDQLFRLLQVLEGERQIFQCAVVAEVLFLDDLCGVARIHVTLLGAEIAHAAKVVLLLRDRILGGELTHHGTMLVKRLIELLVHELDQFGVESARPRIILSHAAAYCQYTGEPHYYKLKN